MSTERKIQDFLHYYLGSQIQVEYGFPEDKKIGILTGFRAGAGWEIWPHKEPFVKVPVGNRVVPAIVRDELVKPILRNLTDITDDEAITVCELYNPLPFEGHRKKNWQVDRSSVNEYQYLYLKNERNDFSFNIDCKEWSLEMYNKNELCETHNIMKSTHYLLMQGFDLFGLLESELAINKTTLKP